MMSLHKNYLSIDFKIFINSRTSLISVTSINLSTISPSAKPIIHLALPEIGSTLVTTKKGNLGNILLN